MVWKTCGKPAQSGAIGRISLRWDVPGPLPLESPGSQWLIMPGAARPKAAQCKEISADNANILLSDAIHGTSVRIAGKAMPGKGHWLPLRHECVLKQAPQWWLQAYFRGLLLAQSSQRMTKSRQRWKIFFCVLKWLSSNKNIRNKYISITPFKVVSWAPLSFQNFIKAIGFPGATQNRFAGKGHTKTLLNVPR